MLRDAVVAADVGGTFTDLVAVEGSSFFVAKVPSTPSDPGLAVAAGVQQLATSLNLSLERVVALVHGTTVATNAVIQRHGARTALLTTAGFRDVTEIARQARPRLFDFDARRPEPLVPRALRFEVAERIDAAGESLEPLDEAALARIVRKLRKAGVESIAVSFLHAYRNSAHEQRARALIEDAWTDVPISLSSEVIPEYREYERTSTTVVNAFVGPIMSRYLTAMERRLRERGMAGPLRVMQSNGGLMSAERASRLPVATVLSGVAAGALGGVRIAHRAGHQLALTLDMGGTSCDLALGIDGDIVTSRNTEIGGLPIRMPALDVHTIGAGGGSVAYLDPGGALTVGPRSAGAEPGPAAYGRGGEEPTVTDANLMLGRLPPDGLIGGAVPLDAERAATAIAGVAEPLGLALEAAAAGIVRVVNAAMARQMRVLTVERGVDPRECSLVAFGGSGPVHAAELALELGISNVIIPPSPGVTSALGLVLADAKNDQVRTVLIELSMDDLLATGRRLEETFVRLEQSLVDELRIGTSPGEALVRREVEMRYRRQGHELRVPVPTATLDDRGMRDLVDAFHEAHHSRFGYSVPEEDVIIVNALATARAASNVEGLRPGQTTQRNDARSRRSVFFKGQWHDAAIVARPLLRPAEAIQGPAIVEQIDSTTVIPPGVSAIQDEFGNLLLGLDG